jgi:hypothetical protein
MAANNTADAVTNAAAKWDPSGLTSPDFVNSLFAGLSWGAIGLGLGHKLIKGIPFLRAA